MIILLAIVQDTQLGCGTAHRVLKNTGYPFTALVIVQAGNIIIIYAHGARISQYAAGHQIEQRGFT